MTLCLLVGGPFHGQTVEGVDLTRSASGVMFLLAPPEEERLASFWSVGDPAPRELTVDRVRYETLPARAAREYFPHWRHVHGAKLGGLLIHPTVQRMGLRQMFMSPEPQCPYPDDIADAYVAAGEPATTDQIPAALVDPEEWREWRRVHARWVEIRAHEELRALRELTASHEVNRLVSEVVRVTLEPWELPPGTGGGGVQYSWLAEVDDRTAAQLARGDEVRHHNLSLVEHLRRTAAREFPEGIPADLQAVLDRATAHEQGPAPADGQPARLAAATDPKEHP